MAVGTGCVLVHAPTRASALLVAVEIFTHLFGVDASTVVPHPPGVADWEAVAGAAYDRFVTAHETTHYTGPARTVVRVGELEPADVYRFLIAGTSSENLYRNALVDLLEPEMRRTAGEIEALGRRALACQADVASFTRAHEVVADVVHQWGRIDFLLNDAGASNAKGILEIREEEFDRTIAVNLKSCFNYIHAIAPVMLAQETGGRIASMSSLNALSGGVTTVPLITNATFIRPASSTYLRSMPSSHSTLWKPFFCASSAASMLPA